MLLRGKVRKVIHFNSSRVVSFVNELFLTGFENRFGFIWFMYKNTPEDFQGCFGGGLNRLVESIDFG